MSTAEHALGGHAAPAEHHPGVRTYVIVGLILAVITSIEVAIYYIEAIKPVLAPILLVLSAVKFATVVAFFMHLRFDNRYFTYMFGFGLLVAGSIITALIFLFVSKPLPPKVPAAPHGATTSEQHAAPAAPANPAASAAGH